MKLKTGKAKVKKAAAAAGDCIGVVRGGFAQRPINITRSGHHVNVMDEKELVYLSVYEEYELGKVFWV